MCASVLSHFSCVWLSATPGTVACQAPLSMGYSRQQYRSGLLCPPPGDLPDPGTEPVYPALQEDSLSLSHRGSPWEGITIPKSTHLFKKINCKIQSMWRLKSEKLFWNHDKTLEHLPFLKKVFWHTMLYGTSYQSFSKLNMHIHYLMILWKRRFSSSGSTEKPKIHF